MGKLNIKESLEVNANASKAWEIVGPGFVNIADWGRGVNKSWVNESSEKVVDEAPAGGRYCNVSGFGKFDERIIHYVSEKREISWSATGEKLPKFMSGLQNELRVEEVDENSCIIHSNISANLSGLVGFIMGSMIKMKFTKTIKGFLSDWKVYAETGVVSDKKQAEISKL
jgi:hypothetical protein